MKVLEREVAALREENARLKHAVPSEAILAASEAARDAAILEAAQLRARVAALVRGIRLASSTSCNSIPEFRRQLRHLLDAPDLAALVAREQATEAVVDAARDVAEWVAAVLTSDIRRMAKLRDALRALDAAETEPAHRGATSMNHPDLQLEERSCDVCNADATAVRFHPKYPSHVYALCDEHDSDECVAQLVAEYEATL